jgi:monoterpene epsilon-lactone hydrolase
MLERDGAMIGKAARALILIGALGAVAIPAGSQTPPAPDRIVTQAANGTMQVRNAQVPVSPMMSEEARQALIATRPTEGPGAAPPPEISDMTELRRQMNERLQPNVARMRAAFPVDVEESVIDGIPVAIITPRGGVPARNRNRVLINAPGGGFRTGIRANGLMVSIPVASLGGFRIVSILYRQGPEFRFPAATEDFTRVYRAMLRAHPARNIGLFGCSAGGALVAESIAHFQRIGLPMPGVAGIYCAGAGAQFDGDSSSFAGLLLPSTPGQAAAPPPGTAPIAYFEGMDIARPDITPANDLSILSRFPPTIFITGSRDFAMSRAAYSHRRMLLAGVESDLLIYDGLGHGFMTNAALPETREAQRIAAAFYDRHLGR